MALCPVGFRAPKKPYGSSISRADCACPCAQKGPATRTRTNKTMRFRKSESIGLPLGYSIFGIAVDRKHILKWLFPQEKATFQCTQEVSAYSENALRVTGSLSFSMHHLSQQTDKGNLPTGHAVDNAGFPRCGAAQAVSDPAQHTTPCLRF